MVMLETGLARAMNARIIGSGTAAIVLAHGYGGDQSLWDKITPHLANHCKVLLFDWTFSGAVKDSADLFDPSKYSSYDGFAADLIALMDEFDLRASVFVGHSMSGMIGCIASIKRPDLFQRLLLVGASPRYINIDDYEGGFEVSDIESIMSNIESNYQNWAPNFAYLVVDATDPQSVEKFTKCLLNMKPEVALCVAKTVFYSDERATLEKVVTPCTIVQTTNDVVVPNSVVRFMQERISGRSAIEMVETDGHFPQLTAHNQLIDVINGVLGFEDH